MREKPGQAPAVFGRQGPVALRPDDECGLAEARESSGGAAQQVPAGEDGAEHADRVAADAALGEDWFQAVAASPRLVSHPNAFGSYPASASLPPVRPGGKLPNASREASTARPTQGGPQLMSI
jgi:hypothetical protein